MQVKFLTLVGVVHKGIYGAFYFINARGEEVLRAADRLHKPPLLHKRQNMLSNCQNLYFEACDRLAV